MRMKSDTAAHLLSQLQSNLCTCLAFSKVPCLIWFEFTSPQVFFLPELWVILLSGFDQLIYIYMEINGLKIETGRGFEQEKNFCPLQIQVKEWLFLLWARAKSDVILGICWNECLLAAPWEVHRGAHLAPEAIWLDVSPLQEVQLMQPDHLKLEWRMSCLISPRCDVKVLKSLATRLGKQEISLSQELNDCACRWIQRSLGDVGFPEVPLSFLKLIVL